MAANKTFLGSVHRNCPEQFEAIAGAAITPGMLVRRVANELVPHAVNGGGGFVYVAKELTAGGTVDDAYAQNETAQSYIPFSGDLYQMLVATGQALTEDTPLTSNGAGLLRIAVADAGTGETFVPGDAVVCYADETITTTATTKVRVKFK
jgi:hypothetical protein